MVKRKRTFYSIEFRNRVLAADYQKAINARLATNFQIK